MSDGPWIPTKGGQRRTIHVDRSCWTLERDGVSLRPASQREREIYDNCQHCGGEVDLTGEHGPRLAAKLEKMSPQEFEEARAR